MTLASDTLEPAIQTSSYGAVVHETLAPRYRLTWLDQGLYNAPQGEGIKPYLRERDFKHLGGAISWARRRIFRGEVFGDTIELGRVDRGRIAGAYVEDVRETRDITLAGFWSWGRNNWSGSSDSIVLEAPIKRCIWE